MAYLQGCDAPAPATPTSTIDAHEAIRLLQSACSNRAIRLALERLLRQPREQRKLLAEAWANEMRTNHASAEFVHAVHSLAHDDVAAQAAGSLFRHA